MDASGWLTICKTTRAACAGRVQLSHAASIQDQVGIFCFSFCYARTATNTRA